MTEIQFYITAVAAITIGLIFAIYVYAIKRCDWVRDQRIKLLIEDRDLYKKLPSFREMVDGHGFWGWDIKRYLPKGKKGRRASHAKNNL